jgi:hypothetical protein
MLYWPSPGSPPDLVGRLTEQMLTMIDAVIVSRGPRPRARDRLCMLWPQISRADFTRLLIWLECLGLAIDPAPWVELVRPAIVKLPTLTASEIAILWYPRERHRKRTRLAAAPDELCRRGEVDLKFSHWTTIMGYRVQGCHDTAGRLLWMSVVGSRGVPRERRSARAADIPSAAQSESNEYIPAG